MVGAGNVATRLEAPIAVGIVRRITVAGTSGPRSSALCFI